MTGQQQKEQFSIAYVRAVAAVAGVKAERPEIDDDSVDIRFSIRSIAGASAPPLVEVQLKCTAADVLRTDGVHFPLPRKNYNELRGERTIPRYLIVVTVPPDLSEWIQQSEDELVLRKCGYWLSLANHGPTENETSVNVVLPRGQLFSPSSLQSWFPPRVPS
jgi:hypothetical protein